MIRKIYNMLAISIWCLRYKIRCVTPHEGEQCSAEWTGAKQRHPHTPLLHIENITLSFTTGLREQTSIILQCTRQSMYSRPGTSRERGGWSNTSAGGGGLWANSIRLWGAGAAYWCTFRWCWSTWVKGSHWMEHPSFTPWTMAIRRIL